MINLTENTKKYHSKLLLFGEYTVTMGSGALAIPYHMYCGQWSYDPTNTASHKGLMQLYTYLISRDDLPFGVDFGRYKQNLDNELTFTSNIPTGYGLGSSGAVVAAFYDTYCDKHTDPHIIKSHLAIIESAFHGASSGIDPLVSLLDSSIKIGSQGDIVLINEGLPLDQIFIIDTGIERRTEPLIDQFKALLRTNNSFMKAMDQLAILNQEAIRHIQSHDQSSLWIVMTKISQIQYDHMSFLIPPSFNEIWYEGLSSDFFKLKLCGAGGGGMLMGMAKDKEKILNHLPKNTITFI